MRDAPDLDWAPFDAALARVRDAGGRPSIWWRDDDAIAYTPALDRLLALSDRYDAPVTIAAVPGRVEPSLPARLAEAPLATIAVHGLMHRNHAPVGEKKAELGPHRPFEILAADTRAGLEAARAAFGPRLLPVMVPPWNRIAATLADRLAALGYVGLSVYGLRGAAPHALARVNTHVDPIAWHAPGRGLADPAELIARAAAALEAGEPVGLLTHHTGQAEAVWAFCDAFLARSARHGLRFATLAALVAEAHTAVTEP